ncbi:HAD family phosphatase [Streptomyces sp. Caat 7-52]|uniref:HAD family hydrolase n=1 Tax=Streptomyces sp. Caat 7-52 TaxID=2949637 RepID=UPI002034F757|nr:HAD family phosphatase [Streptomyces sp. Caat 7-52]
MTEQLGKLRMAALNIDGVLLNDTFSPVIHHFVTSRGGTYSADLERRIFSQPQAVAGKVLAETCGLSTAPMETIALYLQERERYLADHPVRILDGAVELLHRLRALGLRTVCYGGLDASHFERYLGHLADLFDEPRYVCTNDIRPGLHEIAVDIAGLARDEVLFIDDVARVAEAARDLGVPFVGHPSDFEHGHQRQLMAEAGVRHLVGALDEIDERLVRTIDAEAQAGTLWGRAGSALA